MAAFKHLVEKVRQFFAWYDRMIALGTLQRDMKPHIVFADLREGDIIGFELPGALLSVKVVDPVRQLVFPCGWHYLRKEVMQFRGVAVAAGHHATFGSTHWAGSYITLAPARRILLNGLPVPEGRLLR